MDSPLNYTLKVLPWRVLLIQLRLESPTGLCIPPFKKDLKFDVGVEMVDAAVDMLKGFVEEAQRLQMNPRLFIDAVVSGKSNSPSQKILRLSIFRRGVGKILYDRVMSALREQIAPMGLSFSDTTQPPVEPPPRLLSNLSFRLHSLNLLSPSLNLKASSASTGELMATILILFFTSALRMKLVLLAPTILN